MILGVVSHRVHLMGTADVRNGLILSQEVLSRAQLADDLIWPVSFEFKGLILVISDQ